MRRQFSVLGVGALAAVGAALAQAGEEGGVRDAFVRQTALDARSSPVARLVLNLEMGRPGAEQALVSLLVDGVLDAAAQQDAWEALCGHRFREQRYGEAAVACSNAEQLEPGSAAQAAAIAQLAASTPPVSWSVSTVRVPLRDGRIRVSANGYSAEAVLDTGAEIAVLMESAAHALGARAIGVDASVGTTTEPVAGGLAVVPELDIGGAKLRNLLAVVLPDSQLTIGDIRMPVILSMPVLTSMRRAAFVNHGAELILGAEAPEINAPFAPLYWDESGVGFGVEFGGGLRGVHFDTGANESYLFPAARSVLRPEEWASAENVVLGFGGLGGVRHEQGRRLRNVRLGIGGQAWRLDTIDMAAEDVNGESARVGRDLLTSFARVLVDFENMRLAVEAEASDEGA